MHPPVVLARASVMLKHKHPSILTRTHGILPSGLDVPTRRNHLRPASVRRVMDMSGKHKKPGGHWGIWQNERR